MQSSNRIKKITVYILALIIAIPLIIGCAAEKDEEKPDIRPLLVSGDSAASENSISEDSVSSSDIVSENSASEKFIGSPEVSEQLIMYDEMTRIKENADYCENFSSSSFPSACVGEVVTGYFRDIFFANGTPIEIKNPDVDVTGWAHSAVLQAALGNGLGPDNRGYGAIITWDTNGVTNYVVVSNMCQVFGGSNNTNLAADVSIKVDGSTANKSYPNVSFIFGGCMGADIIGDINISITDGAPMYIYGGGLNGSVFGNVDISLYGRSFASDVVGGGLAYPLGSDAVSLVDGNVSIRMKCDSKADTNCVIGGGFAYSDNDCVAIADVTGNILVYVDNQNLYELCGGGMAVSTINTSGLSIANVYGTSTSYFANADLLYDKKSTYFKPGVMYGGGMSDGGIAGVFGGSSVSYNEIKINRNAIGLYEGGNNRRYDLSEYWMTESYMDAFKPAVTYLDPALNDIAFDRLCRIGYKDGSKEYGIYTGSSMGNYIIYLDNYLTGNVSGVYADTVTDDMMSYPGVMDINENYYNDYCRKIHNGMIDNIMSYIDTGYVLYDAETEKSIYRPTPATALLWRGL